MTLLRTGLLLAALALGACTSADRFGAGSGTGTGANGALGSVDDPTSPAYFNAAIGDRVLFAVDQSVLSVEAQAVLSEQARWLTTNVDYSALIEGHADEQGTREYNLALGARRANAVREYLMSRGLPAGRPKTLSCPRVLWSRPRIILIVVLLPEPFGPSRPKISPRLTFRSNAFNA